MKAWLATLGSRGLGTQSAVLVVTVLVGYVLVAPVAGLLSGVAGLGSAATAAGLCLLGAGLALIACRPLRGPKYAFHRVLIGMLLRMGVPLVSALVLQLQGGALAKAGLLIYLLVFYPVTLCMETLLTLPSSGPPPRRGGVSGKPGL